MVRVSWGKCFRIALSVMVSHSLLTLESLLIYLCVCVWVCVRVRVRVRVRVPCIHQQRGCGREDIPIWRNVSHASLLDDLREKKKEKGGGRQRGKEREMYTERLGLVHRSRTSDPMKNAAVFCALTQWVAPRCGTFHVEVVALVEAPSFWAVGKVVGGGLFEWQLFGQSLVLLLWNHNVVARRHKVVAGAGNLDVWLWGRGVTCRGARRGLVPVRPLFQVCWANQDKGGERE